MHAIQFSTATLGMVNIARYTGGTDGARIIAIAKTFHPTVILGPRRGKQFGLFEESEVYAQVVLLSTL